MSNVIDFLEKLGSDARLRTLAPGELHEAMAQARLEQPAQAALLSGDPRRLEAWLGAQSNVCCMVHAPDEEEPEPDEDQDDDGKGKSEDDVKQSAADARLAMPGRATARI